MTTPACGCRETYPQLVPGRLSHAPRCAGAIRDDKRDEDIAHVAEELGTALAAIKAGEFFYAGMCLKGADHWIAYLKGEAYTRANTLRNAVTNVGLIACADKRKGHDAATRRAPSKV